MCGICAFFAYNPVAPPVEREELIRVRDHMSRRGPDGEGAWFSSDGRVGLGHRRLSIIDLSEAGAQPISNEDGTVWLTFNGEIYNYKSLREWLLQRGHTFRSNSDSEVLVHLYEEKGEAMVEALRGMFAFALWDGAKRTLLLARDPYGIKPLYYADDGWTVRVASQVRALVSGRVSREREPAGIASFYLFGSVLEPYTVYRDIRSVPAGSTVVVDDRGVGKSKKYFSVSAAYRTAADDPARAIHDPVAPVREALLDSVRHHFVSDVPVGVFLSGGVDSGAILGLTADLGFEGLQTVTLAFAEYQGLSEDEAPLAEQVSRQYSAKQITRFISAAEFIEEAPKILDAMDQPSIDGVNTYFVSKAAAELGLKVALSGLGGDELFGGYPSFRQLPTMVRAFRPARFAPYVGRLARIASRAFMPSSISPKAAGLIEYGGTYEGAYMLRRGLFMPWELATVMGKELAVEGLRRLSPIPAIRSQIDPDPRTPFSRVASLESSLYMRNQLLRDADWAGMAHSLEIRVPLVDSFLLRSIAPVTVDGCKVNGCVASDKTLLAQSPSRPLPESITSRAKTGFTVPIDRWLDRSGLDLWRKIPQLARPGVHWSRRWAFTAAALGL